MNKLLDDLFKRTERIEKQVKKIQTNAAPTIPTYDSANFPQDAIPGQIAKDQSHAVWVHGEDGVWHPVGGSGSDRDLIAPTTQQTNLFNGGANRDGDLNYVKIDNGIGLPGGRYLNNFEENAFGGSITVTPNNGDLFYARFVLAPQGSIWKFQIGYIQGPDYGKIQFGLASNAEDVDPGDGRGIAGRLVGSTGLTYNEPGSGWWNIDCYGATNLATYDTLALVQINGAPGVPQTSLTQHFPYSGSETGFESDGGSNVYTLRGRVNGKTGSSYKFGLWSVVAMRIGGDDSQD